MRSVLPLEERAIVEEFAGIQMKVSGADTDDGKKSNVEMFRDGEERKIEAT